MIICAQASHVNITATMTQAEMNGTRYITPHNCDNPKYRGDTAGFASEFLPFYSVSGRVINDDLVVKREMEKLSKESW